MSARKILPLFFFSVLVFFDPVCGLTDAQESAFPRRSCMCDIGVKDHVMIMPIHEKSRPLKNCLVAVEYCKQICGPAVARQIYGFREFSGLEDVTLATKPFWNMQRSLGDLLCQNLGRETSAPLELAVYSQAKSCGRRVPALNGTFTAERLCCQQDQHSALVRAFTCPFPTTTTVATTTTPTPERSIIITEEPTTTTTTTTKTTTSRSTSARPPFLMTVPHRRPKPPHRLPTVPVGVPSAGTTIPTDSTEISTTILTTTTVAPRAEIPEPIEMHGEMRARMKVQFRQFIDLLTQRDGVGAAAGGGKGGQKG
ncbi:hypothetical protein BV898_00309 [Hypsibius exemplaris]|uniref:Uncharacterized protein n=1 Tax=Hypsibius exemplaris TaxID=2072580 RepID=A0A1W0XFC6_HYPEX|nr:hypothetical protein BV898_00309 [Hypsibius exemplaris]